MLISTTQTDNVTLATLVGRLDASGAPELETQGRALIDGGARKLLIDMAAVDYISSAGLRSLLVLAKAMKAVSGAMVLCSLTSMTAEVMEISGFSKILTIAADQNAAQELLK